MSDDVERIIDRALGVVDNSKKEILLNRDLNYVAKNVMIDCEETKLSHSSSLAMHLNQLWLSGKQDVYYFIPNQLVCHYVAILMMQDNYFNNFFKRTEKS